MQASSLLAAEMPAPVTVPAQLVFLPGPPPPPGVAHDTNPFTLVWESRCHGRQDQGDDALRPPL
jgi:hypothetical protein